MGRTSPRAIMGVITLMMSKGARGMAALHRQLVYIVGVVYFGTPSRSTEGRGNVGR